MIGLSREPHPLPFKAWLSNSTKTSFAVPLPVLNETKKSDVLYITNNIYDILAAAYMLSRVWAAEEALTLYQLVIEATLGRSLDPTAVFQIDISMKMSLIVSV